MAEVNEQRTSEKPHGNRKASRRCPVDSWFPRVARTMADGTSLPDALKRHGIALEKRQIRALCGNDAFKQLYQGERQRHQRSDLYFKKRRTREERFRRSL